MAFGAELKDFVSGFKTGYELIDSPEDKEWKRKEREMKTEGFEREGRWGEEDRARRRERDAIGDDQWNRSNEFQTRKFDWMVDTDQRDWKRTREQDERQAIRDGVEDERWSITNRQRQDWLRLNEARQGGAGEVENQSEWLDREGMGERNQSTPQTAIPEGDEGASLQPTSYGGGGYEPTSGQEIAWNMVQDLEADYGMPKHVAIGITGALAGETGGFTQMQELNPLVEGSRGGGGYAMWTGPRRRQFEDFAGERNPTSYHKNYAFLRHELDNTPEGRVLEALRNAKTSEEAQRIFTSKFLRPGIPNWEGRAAWTKRVGSLFGGGRKAVNVARGGMISAIPEDEEEVDPMTTNSIEVASNEEAIPTGDAPTPTPRPQYEGEGVTSEGNSDEEEPFDYQDMYDAGRRAVRDGMERAIDQSGAGQDSALNDPELEKIRQNYIRGYGAAPKQMMKQVMDRIDPERQMAPGERNIMAMGTVYRYYMEQGDQEKAKEAAASMVQYYRQQSQQFLAMAQAAASEGDIPNAVKAAIAGYANVPNGRDLDIAQNDDGSLTVSVTDAKTGKPISKQVVSPKEFAAAAMQFNPTTFDDEILNAAGVPAEKYDDASLEDVGKINEEIRNTIETDFEGSGLSKEGMSAIGDIATDIAKTKQNGVSGTQAVRLAAGLLDAQEEPKHKPVRGNPDLVEVEADGHTVVMSKGQFKRIQSGRANKAKLASEKAAADKASSERTSKQMDDLWKGAAAFGSAVVSEPPAEVQDRNKERHENIQKARSQMGAIPDGEETAEEAPAEAIPSGDTEASFADERIQELLDARDDAIARAKASNKDPKQFGLDEINAALAELGYKESAAK